MLAADAPTTVAFQSAATNLIIGTTTLSNTDVFLNKAGTLSIVSADNSGMEAAGGDSTNPSIDGAG